MTDLDAIMIIESDENATREEELAAWQQLVDSGTYKGLQGFYQRGVKSLLQQGLIHLPESKKATQK